MISKNTYVFQIFKIVILDIKNNNFGYQKINVYFLISNIELEQHLFKRWNAFQQHIVAEQWRIQTAWFSVQLELWL